MVLLALAYYLIANEEELFGSTTKEEMITAPVKEGDVATISTEPKLNIKQDNKAAEGLSRFYANLRGTDEGSGPRIRNNIVYLPEPQGELIDLLEAKRLTTRPLRSNWKGTKANRPFRQGYTLHQKLREYAEQDGIDIIWRLNRDFVIKNPFRIDKNIIDTAYQIGQAISGHFQDGLKTFFCNQQRTIVFIEKESQYLEEECILLPLKRR